MENIQVVEPQVVEENLVMRWNREEMISYLDNRLKKYENLVVSESNLKEMKATLREVISYRTKLTAFGRDKKRELKRPAEIFDAELQQVLSVVAKYENPLAQQINVFEEEETAKRKQAVYDAVKAKASELGIRDEYMRGYVPQAKWWNKTAKVADVTIAIEHELNSLLDKQRQQDNYVKMMEEKKAMLNDRCDVLNMNYGLATPVDFEKIYPRIQNLDFMAASKELENIFIDRLDMETAAQDKVQDEEVENVFEPDSEPVECKVHATLTIIIKGDGVKKIDSIKNYLDAQCIEYSIV